jgi:hypothetical protein
MGVIGVFNLLSRSSCAEVGRDVVSVGTPDTVAVSCQRAFYENNDDTLDDG